MNVRDVMTRGAISVSPHTPLRDLARLLSERRISGVPVVDQEGRCLGVVSEADLLVKQLSRPLSRRLPLEWLLGESHDPDELRRRAATTAEQAMTSPAVTIDEDRPLREAAALMVDRGINRLPVLADGRLVGMLSRSDLVRAYLRLDDDIEHAVRDEVLQHTMWLDPNSFDIEVRDGTVRIWGQVDRRSTARILEKLIGLVDGVLAVEALLDWESDDTVMRFTFATEGEPGAASLAARERPAALHR